MIKTWEFESGVVGVDNFIDSGKIIARIIKLERKEGFDFKAGQFVMITMPGYEPGDNWNKQLWRAYSVCSSPMQDEIELCLSIKEPPSFTYFLDKTMQPGSKIKVKGPFGGFTMKDNTERLIFIAAGTGIAPIMSMARTLALAGSSVPVEMLYGYRNSSQFYYGAELQQLAEKMENFQLLTIASREGPNPGHVQRLIESKDFENKAADIYICGPPKMVDEAKQIMLDKGFEKTRIHVEKYD